jgi:hypothetical protein
MSIIFLSPKAFQELQQPQQKPVEHISTNPTLTSVHMGIYTYPIFQETQEIRSKFIYKYNMTATSVKLHHGSTLPTLLNQELVLCGPQVNFGIDIKHFLKKCHNLNN